MFTAALETPLFDLYKNEVKMRARGKSTPERRPRGPLLVRISLPHVLFPSFGPCVLVCLDLSRRTFELRMFVSIYGGQSWNVIEWRRRRGNLDDIVRGLQPRASSGGVFAFFLFLFFHLIVYASYICACVTSLLFSFLICRAFPFVDV